MDPTPENRGKTEHTVIGQEFQLFDPIRTTPRKSPIPALAYNGFGSTVTLDLPPLGQIPFRIGADVLDEEVRRDEAFTPFDPEVGYQVTYRDFDPVALFKSKDRSHLDISKAPLTILVGASGEDFLEEDGPYLYEGAGFKEKARAILTRLRLELDFPASAFEGALDDGTLDDGHLLFSRFYPLDTGPLGDSRFTQINVDGKRENVFMPEGLMIHIPSNLQELAQIKGSFKLALERSR